MFAKTLDTSSSLTPFDKTYEQSNSESNDDTENARLSALMAH